MGDIACTICVHWKGTHRGACGHACRCVEDERVCGAECTCTELCQITAGLSAKKAKNKERSVVLM